eukprot:scaffold1470_cov118-Isochrysis_galbana.AAC.3
MRCAASASSGRMRQDTLYYRLSSGGLALPPLSPPPFTFSPGARPIISGNGGVMRGGREGDADAALQYSVPFGSTSIRDAVVADEAIGPGEVAARSRSVAGVLQGREGAARRGGEDSLAFVASREDLERTYNRLAR